LRRIGELLDAGLNLAGIAAVLDLEDTNDELRAELDEQQWKDSRRRRGHRSFDVGGRGTDPG
jgi:DNA-binding transcriptional MerR regulator